MSVRGNAVLTNSATLGGSETAVKAMTRAVEDFAVEWCLPAPWEKADEGRRPRTHPGRSATDSSQELFAVE
jgi:hypothetical protein